MSDPVAGDSDDAEACRQETEFRLAEYRSVREEWLASRNAQHQTLQWTLAALAVLLAGILNSNARSEHPFLYVALTAAVVAVATCSQAIWFGEVTRMERASLFLRGFEEAFGRPRPSAPGRLPTLLWERWRGDPEMSRGTPWVQKAAPSIVASFALYGLIAATGLVILVSAAADKQFPQDDRHLAIVMACVAGVLYLLVTVYLCVQALSIHAYSSKPAEFEAFRSTADEGQT